MAFKFIGERTVGTLNGMKSGFVKDDLYRVYNAGILVPGGVSVDHGDFVSWDGTKWKLETDIKIARSDEISSTNSNIAPNYTKKTYEANSYVMQGGVLYTNPNAIGTAEDWNPAHWTQTTVAEMMAGAGNSGYTQVNLTFGQSDTKTIPVGQKEEVHAACAMKAGDNVIIRLAQDCTDAILLFEHTNNISYRSLKVMRGTTQIKYYGGGLVGKISTFAYQDSNKVMLTTYTEGGDHGEQEPAPPTDLSEVTLANTDEILSIVDHWKVKDLINGAATGTWLFVVKGSYVMCLPE
jgi:hypothetical protein